MSSEDTAVRWRGTEKTQRIYRRWIPTGGLTRRAGLKTWIGNQIGPRGGESYGQHRQNKQDKPTHVAFPQIDGLCGHIRDRLSHVGLKSNVTAFQIIAQAQRLHRARRAAEERFLRRLSACRICGHTSVSIHSRYQRLLSDLQSLGKLPLCPLGKTRL